MKYDSLIYGKDQTERIVSLEVDDSNCELFIEDKDGTVRSEFIPNKYWILSPKPLKNKWIKLAGNLHYQYGQQYETRHEFFMAKNFYKSEDIFSISDAKEALMVKNGITYYKGMDFKEVSVLSFDIETTGLEHDLNSKVLLISNTFRKKGRLERKLFAYSDYETDAEMFDDWCNWVKEINPSIMLGHNIFLYDLPYLAFCADRAGTSLALGRDGSDLKFNNYESKFRKDGSQFYHYKKSKVYGRELVDTMFLSIKYDVGRKYESYGLKNIIKQEGLEIEGRQFYDASKIRTNYKIPEEWEKIKAYAEHDADDALALYDLMGAPFFYMTQSIAKPYQMIGESATGSQINSMMVRAYLQDKHSVPKADEVPNFGGGISLGNPGIYTNVYKLDVASLYPSIMIEYKVFDKDKDPNAYFSKLVNTFTERRFHHKKLAKDSKYDDDMQGALKILINSAYGFLGTPGLLFNSPKNAAFVTEKGREILTKAINWAAENELKLINADTDSIAVSKEDEKLITEEERDVIRSEINWLFPDKINWEDDGYYPKFIVLKAKNYILYDGKKVKYKGSALKSSTKEIALQQFMKDIIQTILDDKNEFVEIYNRYVLEALDIKDIKRWASKKTITEKVLNAERTNEQKVLTAIEGTEYVEGDKVFTYFLEDDSLGLIENFDGNYNKDKMLEKIYKTSKVFETILDIEQIFPNYKLKKNKQKLIDLSKEL